MNIAFITAAQTIDLRHAVLRSHQARDACHYPGDQDPESFHVGASVDGALQCVASFFLQDSPYCPGDKVFRLRGMATAQAFRGQGLGRSVLEHGCAHARAQGASKVWCNARTTAIGFYTQRGFVKVSKEFELEGIGPHFVLARVL